MPAHTHTHTPFPSLPGNSSPLTRGLVHASHLSYHNIMPEVTPATFVSAGDNSSLKPQPTVFYTPTCICPTGRGVHRYDRSWPRVSCRDLLRLQPLGVHRGGPSMTMRFRSVSTFVFLLPFSLTQFICHHFAFANHQKYLIGSSKYPLPQCGYSTTTLSCDLGDMDPHAHAVSVPDRTLGLHGR